MVRKTKHKNRKRHLPKLGQESNVYFANRLWKLRTWRVFSLLTLHFVRDCTFPWRSLSIIPALMLIFCLSIYLSIYLSICIYIYMYTVASPLVAQFEFQWGALLQIIHLQVTRLWFTFSCKTAFWTNSFVQIHWKTIQSDRAHFAHNLQISIACSRSMLTYEIGLCCFAFEDREIRRAAWSEIAPKMSLLSTVAHSLSTSAVFHIYQMLHAICGSTSLQWFGSAYCLCCLLMRKMEVWRATDKSNR